MHPKSVSRRLLLGSSALAVATAAAFTAPGRAAPNANALDNAADASDVTSPAEISQIRGKKKKQGKKVPNAAMLRDFDKNPHLRPMGAPLSPAEQAQYKQQATAASGRGL